MSNEIVKIRIPITVILTDYCNRDCEHCSESATMKKSESSELNLELFLKEFENLCGDKNAPLMLSGGEPTLHSDFRFENGSYLKVLSKLIDRFKDVIICTNGWWVKIYTGKQDYSENNSFRESVDDVKRIVSKLILNSPKSGKELKAVRLSLTANSWLAYGDIDRGKRDKILMNSGINEKQLLNIMSRDDLHERMKNENDPEVRILKESNLYKRVQVLKEADRQLKGGQGIKPDQKEVLLYFCIVASGISSDKVKLNQDAVMEIFGIPEELARRSPLYSYGRASGWRFARKPPIEKEPELVIRPGPNGTILVYDSKYLSRTDKTQGKEKNAIGIIKKPGDLIEILNKNPKITSGKTRYLRQSM